LGERWTTGSLGPHVRLPAQDYNFDAVFDEPLGTMKSRRIFAQAPTISQRYPKKGEPSKKNGKTDRSKQQK